MRGVWRWLRRIVLALLALVVVAVAAVLIVLHTDWGRNLVRKKVVAALQGSFPGSTIESLTGSVLGTLVLHDVRLVARDARELVSIGTLELEISLLPLLGSTARIDSLIARDVNVHARPLPPDPPEPDAPPTAWSIELPAIEVHGATVTIERTGDVVRDLDLAAVAEIPAGAPIRAAAMVSGTWRDRPIVGLGAITAGADVTAFASLGLGGSALVASDIVVGARRGRVIARMPAAELAALAPMLPISGDARLAATVVPRGAEAHVSLAATVGAARVDAVALVDVAAQTARGLVGTTAIDLAAVTGGRVRGAGHAVIAAVADRTRARATIIAGSPCPAMGSDPITGQAGSPCPGMGSDPITGQAVLAVDTDFVRADVLALVVGAAGDVRIGGLGAVTRAGDVVTVEDARVGAKVADPMAASGGLAPVHGAITVEATARGPVTALAVGGTVRGTGLRYQQLRVARLGGTFRGELGATPLGTAHVELGGVANAGQPLGAVTIDAGNRADGRIAVRARGRSATAPVAADVSAVITPGEVIAVALGSHRIDTPSGSWRGTGGSVRVEPRAIRITGIRSAQGSAWASVDATVGRAGGALAASIEAHDLPLAAVDPRYRGTVTATLALGRARGRWSGDGIVRTTGVQLSEDVVPVDAAATLGVDGRRVTLAVNATNAELGGARVGIEVDAPRDLLDVAGWTRVARSDLHAVTIGLDRLDAAVASRGRTAGMLDGTLQIREGVPSGMLRVRGVPTPAGTAEADLTLALTDVGFVDATAKGTVGAVGAATLGARLAIPDHPFDPAEWRALGTRVVDHASAEAKEIAIDPALLAALGIAAPYRGTAGVTLDVGAGAQRVTIGLDAKNVTGGHLVKGLDAHVEATADANGTRAALRLGSGAITFATLDDAATPVTLARWIADPRSALTAPLAGTLAIGEVNAASALAIIGRTDVTGGTIAGKVVAGGTLGTPTAVGTLDLANVTVASPIATKRPPALTALHVDARWGGAAGRLRITAQEEGAGTLLVEASGDPRDPRSVLALVDVKKLDLAPLAVFLPGPLGGAAGILDANLKLTGLDPSLGTVRGSLALREGRVPISAVVGTLRRARFDVTIADTGITAKLDGRLGAGTVTLTAKADPTGTRTVIDASLEKVSPIGAVQPILDAKLHADIARRGLQWTGTATISKAQVVVPTAKGQALLDSAVPSDVFFVDAALPRVPPGARAPTSPFLVVNVDLESTQITVPEYAVDVVAGGKVVVSVGDTVGLDGEILVERGSADLNNHRYRVDLGQLAFDGTTDGLLDLKLAHDFSDSTMFVRFAGRLSEIGTPELSSEPGIYTQGQLFGFFLGAEPGGDPSRQTRDAAVGLGASLASGQLGKYLRRFLPVELDVLRCDPGSATSGVSCTAGKWVTKKLFASYRQRLESRYDENSYEGALEWHFRPSWQLALTAGDRTYGGGDLLWRRRW